MFINIFRYIVKILLSFFMAVLVYGAIWDEFFFENLNTLMKGGDLYPQDEMINEQSLDYVSPKYDKYEYPWDSGVAHHSLLSFNVTLTKSELERIKTLSFIIDSDDRSLVDLKFVWTKDQTGTYLKYFYSYFFDKEKHFENTWYSCENNSCRINVQLYNNYLPIVNGKEYDVKIVFKDDLGGAFLEKRFKNVYFPLDQDAENIDFPKVELIHNENERRFFASIIPKDDKSWAIIQWVDSDGRSDKSIDLGDSVVGKTVEFEYSYNGEIKYLAALIYSSETLSEYKIEIINKDKI